MRLVVPAGAELTREADGMDIGVDNSNPRYSVFSWYTNVNPGNTTADSFAYSVPVSNCRPDLRFYKQAGLTNATVIADGKTIASVTP